MKSIYIIIAVVFSIALCQAQEKISKEQMLAMINEGHSSVQSMNYKKSQASNKEVSSVPSSRQLASSHTTTQMSKEEIENVLNGGKAQVSMQRQLASTQAANSNGKVVLTQKVDLGECNRVKEGKIIFVNNGKEVYECQKQEWIRKR